jgi:hypothetical protein
MNRLFTTLFVAALFIVATPSHASLKRDLKKALKCSVEQKRAQAEYIIPQDGKVVVTYNDGTIKTAGIQNWVSGFLPATLWLLYDFSLDEQIKEYAEILTRRQEGVKNYGRTHDLGFMVYCPFFNAYRITQEPYYKDVINQAAATLATRFTPEVGCIRSWDTHRKSNRENDYIVIIDNMMNLEMMEWCGHSSIARKHADTTLKNHFREDGSAYHILVYNENTGEIVETRSGQGESTSSAWARGQAWGLYGFTMMYRMSDDERYLQQAERIANYLISRLEGDYIPNWDYDSAIKQKDSSAGAIMASALLKLYSITHNKSYRRIAERQLKALISDEYMAKQGENGYFILKHGVGNLPGNSEVDVPLSYGDYYFVEAALRYLNL